MHDFHVLKEDWTFHNKGHDDQRRHREKITEAIAENMKELVAEESVVLSNGTKPIRVPIRSLQEFRIRFSEEKSTQVGQGGGASGMEPGQGAQGEAAPGEAGDSQGVDYEETEIDIIELENLLFDQFELPDLASKEMEMTQSESWSIRDVQKTGITAQIDKKKTLLAAFKRNALTQSMPQFYPVRLEDRRFRTFREEKQPTSKAVIFAMMDTSGSMGAFEKELARSFFFWMRRFLTRHYEQLEIVFIAHHTEASVIEEEAFFKKGESGGTICSSAYKLMLHLMETTYSPSRYNLYAVHFSDGDNLAADSEECSRLAGKIAPHCQLFGYAEVNRYSRTTALMSALKRTENSQIQSFVLKKREDLYPALLFFFGKKK